jgi:hypothetical protein
MYDLYVQLIKFLQKAGVLFEEGKGQATSCMPLRGTDWVLKGREGFTLQLIVDTQYKQVRL